MWFEIVDGTGRLRAKASPSDVCLAAAGGHGLGPPPPTDGYVPTAGQVRFVRARDRHCRFPGCSRPAEYADLDHVVPYDHDDPSTGGPTCITNLVCLCRRHHRLKTHQPGWAFRMDPDGTLHVTLPTGVTRTSRPPALAETDVLTDLLGPTPRRHRSPTVGQQAARRAAAAAHSATVAAIEAEVLAAGARAVARLLDEAPPPF